MFSFTPLSPLGGCEEFNIKISSNVSVLSLSLWDSFSNITVLYLLGRAGKVIGFIYFVLHLHI